MIPSSAGMTDKRMDVDSHVLHMGEYGKNPASRHQIHKDSTMDRNPYMDKVSCSLVSSRIGVFILKTLVIVTLASGYCSTLYGKIIEKTKFKSCFMAFSL